MKTVIHWQVDYISYSPAVHRSWGMFSAAAILGICSSADYFLLYTKSIWYPVLLQVVKKDRNKWKKKQFLHIPLSQFAFAEKRRPAGVIRIRCKKDDLKRCVLHWGDRVAMEEPLPVKQSEMEHVASDMLYDYYEVKITSPYTRVCYYFRLEDDTESLYYYGRGFAEKLSCGRGKNIFSFHIFEESDILDIPSGQKTLLCIIFSRTVLQMTDGTEGKSDKAYAFAG